MSKGVNKAIIVGNVGSKSELKIINNGNKYIEISVATSETYKDKSTGDKKELTEWHTIKFFGALADIAEKYIRKGMKVYVEGKIKTQKWKDDKGYERSKTAIVAEDVNFLTSKNENNNGNEQYKHGYSSSREEQNDFMIDDVGF